MADADLSNSGSGSDNSGIESLDPDSRSVSPVENVDISSGSEKQSGPALKVSKKGTDGGSTDKPHPTTAQMVNTALAQLNDKKGSSLSAIKKFIADNYKLEVTKQFATRICKHLNSGVEKGLVIRTKGAGANGSFKLVENKDVKPKPKPTKTKAVTKKSKPEVNNKEKKVPSAAAVGESSTKENNIKTNKPSAKPLAASSKKQLPPASAAAVSSSKKTAAKPTTATENKAPAKPIKSPAKNVANPNPSVKSPKDTTLQSKAEKPKSPKAVVKPKSPKAKVLLAKTKPPKAVAKPKSPKNPVKAKPSKAPKAK